MGKAEPPALLTMSVTGTVCVMEPLTALIVTGYVPAGVPDTTTCKFAYPVPLNVTGLALAPEGRPLMLTVTLEAKPFSAVTEASNQAWPPVRPIVCLAGDALNAKSAAPLGVV